MIKRPLLIRGLGIYCPNKLDINPKLIEVLICKKDENYTSLGNFELSLSSGTQVLSTEEFLFNDVIYIKFIIKSSFGGSRIYLSNVYLYEHLPGNESALPFNEYNKDKKEEEKIEFMQIKEKYGGLRVYTNFGTKELFDLIEKAEDESYNVCEDCGSREDVGMRESGWLTTMCLECIKKEVKERGYPQMWRRNCDEKLFRINTDGTMEETNTQEFKPNC